MKFALNDEQLSLQDAVKDFLSKRSTSDAIRQAIVSDNGYDQALYSALCTELGLASLVVPEKYGGYGASDVEISVAQEQLGYFLSPTPFRAHIFSQIALMECATDEAKAQHLPELVSGDQLATVIFADEVNRDGLDSLPRDTGSGGVVLSTTLSQVPFGLDADKLYFFATENNDFVYVDLNQDGVNRTIVPSIDQTIPLAKIDLTGVYAQILSDGDSSKNYLRALARTTVALSNEIVGSSQAVLDMAVQYAKDRKQFGRPIGSFQAIKHKCADMLLETQSARSIALYGAWLASQDAGFAGDDLQDDLSHVASMAKYYCSKAFSHAAGENIQIHGGIGFTMEHDAQLYFKRSAFMNAYLGLPHKHAQQLAEDLRQSV